VGCAHEARDLGANYCGSTARAIGELDDRVKPSYGIRSGYMMPCYHTGSVSAIRGEAVGLVKAIRGEAIRGRKWKKEGGEIGLGGENWPMASIGNRILYNFETIFTNCKLI
jgi:hypothetical protein